MKQFETGKGSVPIPEEVARRVATVSDFPLMNPDSAVDADVVRDVFFALADDRAAARAVVRVRQYPRDMRGANALMPPTQAQGDIGHYDPAQQEWLFYPEYVQPKEIAVLTAEMEQQAEIDSAMLLVEKEHGKPFDDMRDPLTVYARYELAELLRGTGIVERLITADPLDDKGNTREVDEATSATLTLTSRRTFNTMPSERSTGPGSVLTLAYRGLRVRGKDFSARINHEIPVGFLTSGPDGEWVPNEYVDHSEWWQLASVPAMLHGYRKRRPTFSISRCVVAHNRME